MFSVIIPVHNAEQTLERCCDSLLRQSCGEFEALLIENGSMDDSLALCRHYAERDDRFHVFSIGACGGPSRPRNFGLDRAAGEYVVFLDADDWFGPRVLEMLSECFSREQADVVFFGFCHEKNGEISEVCFPHVAAEENRAKCLELHAQDCFGYTCCKAFTRRAVGTVRFDETIDLFEDEIFALAVCKTAKIIKAVPDYYKRDQFVYHAELSAHSLMTATHADMIRLKDAEYRAWKAFLDDTDRKALIDLSNQAVSFCRYYVFERRLPLRDAYNSLKAAEFFRDAAKHPNKMTRKIDKGFYEFGWDWIIWSIKNALR